MKKQAGIWIDRKRAIFVFLKEGLELETVIDSDVETRERYEGETNQNGRMDGFRFFGWHTYTDESSNERREQNQIQQFLHAVIKQANVADEFVIFGPSVTKNQLEKMIHENHLISDKLVGVETASQMTENQLVALVKEFFQNRSNNSKKAA